MTQRALEIKKWDNAWESALPTTADHPFIQQTLTAHLYFPGPVCWGYGHKSHRECLWET